MLLPQAFLDGRLDQLSKELQLLDRHVRSFAEVSGASAGSFKVRSCSHGSIEFFLSCEPVTAASLVIAIERIVELYKKMLEIRQLQKQMEQQALPKQLIEGVRKHESEQVNKALQDTQEEILNRYGKKDKGRKNELRKTLADGVRYLADRIDRGVDFEVTAPPQPAPEEEPAPAEGEPRAVEAPRDANLKLVEQKGHVLRFLPREDKPLLCLPPGPDDADDVAQIPEKE